MKRAILVAALMVAAVLPATAQQQRPQGQRPAQPEGRPTWASNLPTAVPEGAIGLIVAERELRRQSFCTLQALVTNNTDAVIRGSHFQVEVFFGERSVVARFHVELVDPGKERLGTISMVEGCPRLPTKVVLRRVELCRRPDFQRRGCGAPFVAWHPPHRLNAAVIPVEIAQDYDR